MFISLSILIQLGLLWILFTWLAGQDESTSKVNAMMVMGVYSVLSFAFRLLVNFQFPEMHWLLAFGIQYGMLYLLIWKIGDLRHRTTALIWSTVVLCTLFLSFTFGI